MAKYFKIVFALVILVLQIFSVTACPARCIVNGGACVFGQPTKCCTPICLEQYGICGKTCANINSSCKVSNDCCIPLTCENNVCCGALGSSCNLNSDCCSQQCNDKKICCTGLALGSTCNLGTECCSGLCSDAQFSNNVCCNNPGDSCTPDEFSLQCCVDFSICIGNICSSI